MTSVMFVDDEEDLVDLFERLLESKGYNVPFVANSGKDAIEIYDNADIKPDIVIIDNYLGDMLGVDVVKYFLKGNPNIKALIASGDLSIGNVFDSLPNIVFLTKPFSLRNLVEEIEKLLSL